MAKAYEFNSYPCPHNAKAIFKYTRQYTSVLVPGKLIPQRIRSYAYVYDP